MDRLMAQPVTHECSDGSQSPYRISARGVDGNLYACHLGVLDIAQHAIGKFSIALRAIRDVEVPQVDPQHIGGLHEMISMRSPVAGQLLPGDSGPVLED